MYTMTDYATNGSNNAKIISVLGNMTVIEYEKDLSIPPEQAECAYFCYKMGIRRRQVIAQLDKNGIIVQAGAMQYTLGEIEMVTNIKGVGDFIGKAFKAKMTNETIVKPLYKGEGNIALEPTYKHIILQNLSEWNNAMTIEDGMFLACSDTITETLVMRNTLSSTIGGEGLFNLALAGNGIVALESDCPMEELVVVDLQNDTMKIDGNMAIAWSSSLNFTVETSTKGLVKSAISGEGLVNVYRGTGRILMKPV